MALAGQNLFYLFFIHQNNELFTLKVKIIARRATNQEPHQSLKFSKLICVTMCHFICANHVI